MACKHRNPPPKIFELEKRASPLPASLAVLTIVKAMVGSGVLGFPYVFSKVRLAVAIPGSLLIAAVAAFGVLRLIECKVLIEAKGPRAEAKNALLVREGTTTVKPVAQDHPEIVTGTMPANSGPIDANFGLGMLATVGDHTFGFVGVLAAGVSIISSQVAVCTSYAAVVVATLSDEDLLGQWASEDVIRVGVCALLCLLCLFKEMRSLAWLSGVAMMIYMYLFVSLFYFGAVKVTNGDGPSPASLWFPVGWKDLGSFLGTALFAQEAIVICQYVYDDMQLESPKQYLPTLFVSVGSCAVLFAIVGTVGFASFGHDIKEVFYMNFPRGSISIVLAELVLSLVMSVSFALQMYPIVSFVESLLGLKANTAVVDSEVIGTVKKGSQNEYDAVGVPLVASETTTKEMSFFQCRDVLQRMVAGAASPLVRCAIVVVTCFFAEMVPNLPCITGYSGSFAMSLVSFILPPIFHHKLKGSQRNWSDNLGNMLLLVSGCIAVFCGCFATSC